MSVPGPMPSGFLSRLSSWPCPTCGYELRQALEASELGVVRCPECGDECDVVGIEAGRKPMTVGSWIVVVAGCVCPSILAFTTFRFVLNSLEFPPFYQFPAAIAGGGLAGFFTLACCSYLIERLRSLKNISPKHVKSGIFVLAAMNLFVFMFVYFALFILMTLEV